MNEKVKRRESFRPFAPSVLKERCSDWFETGNPSQSYRFMLFACPVVPEKAPLIPAVLHIDNTARIHVVEKESNPTFYALIEHFERITGVPMVLNTSFNDTEPIVCSPHDAVSTFLKAKFDALVLGNYIVDLRPQ